MGFGKINGRKDRCHLFCPNPFLGSTGRWKMERVESTVQPKKLLISSKHALLLCPHSAGGFALLLGQEKQFFQGGWKLALALIAETSLVCRGRHHHGLLSRPLLAVTVVGLFNLMAKNMHSALFFVLREIVIRFSSLTKGLLPKFGRSKQYGEQSYDCFFKSAPAKTSPGY